VTTRQLITLSDACRRLLAAGCAALVLLLGVAASSPALHALAHTHAADHEHVPLQSADSADTCAVVLFAQGIALTADTAVLTSHALLRHDLQLPATEEPLLVAARYLHQPERGPPAV